MPGRRRSGWRGRGRGRGRGNHLGVARSAGEDTSRTPTPARDSDGEGIADAQDENTTVLEDEEAVVLEEEQENEEGEGHGEEGEEGDEGGEEDEEADGISGPSKKQSLHLRKPLTPSRTSSEQLSSRRRGGFRGGTAWRGRNWKTKGPLNVQQHPIDLEGNPATIVNDEVVLPQDEEGEKKVDKYGHLEGGREYRVRTFTIDGKSGRLYMLSTEPARCIGFRDSYLFFQKHRQLAKIVLTEDEKHSLIHRSIIPHSYKGRNIGVVTARSVFREFGSRIIIGGRKITDDYHVTIAREAGEIEGEIAVPEDRIPIKGEEYDRKRYVAWHGASAVYHSNAPAVGGVLQSSQNSIIHGPSGPPLKRRKVHVTGSNWMLEHARAASNFNSLLTSLRAANASGQYDIYTNTLHHPSIYLHSHAKWHAVPVPVPTSLSSTSTTPSKQPRSPNPNPNPGTGFPPSPSPYLLRNATTIDTLFLAPPTSTFGLPGPSGVDGWGLGGRGLLDVEDGVVACLEGDCREAFECAREREREWRMGFGLEGRDGGRRVGIRR